MIITQKKPIGELMEMLGDARRVALLGCGSCATVCATGGEAQIAELTEYLEAHGREVTASVTADYCCMNLGVKSAMKKLMASRPDAVVCMSCGDGVQVAANHTDIPVYPSNNTLFLGESRRLGLFEEACHQCGDCMLGSTGGICPVTRCAKSLVNGPCGGSKNGKCEVNPDKDCAWIQIYYRLEKLGMLDRLTTRRRDKDYSTVIYPRTVDIRSRQSR